MAADLTAELKLSKNLHVSDATKFYDNTVKFTKL